MFYFNPYIIINDDDGEIEPKNKEERPIIYLLFPQIPAVAPPPSWTPVYNHHATERDYGVSPPAPPPSPPSPSSSSSPAPPPPPDQVPARIVNQESGSSSSNTNSASSSSVSSSILSEIGLSLTFLIHYKTSLSNSACVQSGLDVTLLVFIIIISVLILGLIILLLVYWFCRPNRGEQDTQHQVRTSL